MYLKTSLLALFLGLGIAAKAQEFKIAVIDMEKVFKGYYKTKIADAKLKKQADVFKNYADKLNKSRVKLMEEFKELRDSSQDIALSEAERENRRLAAQDKYRQLKTKESEYKQYNTDKQRHLRDEYDKMRKTIIEEIQKVVRKKSTLEGYSLVLDVSGKTLNNIPSVIYFNASLDLTDEVLSELNKVQDTEDN